MMTLQIIFWFSFTALLHTYILYPLILKLLSLFHTSEPIPPHDLPKVSILIAAYNEEKVIKQKLESIFSSDFPKLKIEVIVGSDASTDNTNEIIKSFSNIRLVEFTGRSGKIKIINHLATIAKNEILIITDANVIFDQNIIQEMVKHFSNPNIGLVDSNMQNINQQGGISKAESTYIRGEVGIKQNEGNVFGMMMGPFGGCYAVRKNLYEPVPENFLVDDFYINMKVLEKGKKTISEINAKAYEEVPSDWRVEFKRKIRIATGSFQNLKAFFHLLFKFNALSFCFLSHKVLRWLGPFFILGLYISNILIVWSIFTGEALGMFFFGDSFHLHPFEVFFILQNILFLIFICDLILKRLGINFILTRLVSHFLTTNFALFIGFLKFAGGVKSSIWQPTNRT
jgi:cellulose synthase/poly-beta-1,6-N-acetylglucosamine synthase-like glycosyltransferase